MSIFFVFGFGFGDDGGGGVSPLGRDEPIYGASHDITGLGEEGLAYFTKPLIYQRKRVDDTDGGWGEW